ncbi:hypothetical protein HmCmsJML035_04025 [Escherichia coli]|nr:hypothetical protein HmCmsJML035_04025 [Escherichia coli]
MLKPFMPETTQASGSFTGKADVPWDTTKDGLPQGSNTPSGRNVQVKQAVHDTALNGQFPRPHMHAVTSATRCGIGRIPSTHHEQPV